MKGSAQFLMDIMTIEPKHKWLVIPFSMSPEQGYFTSEKRPEVFLSSSTTMNVGMVRDLFPHVIEAEKILNVDQEFGAKLADALQKIPPYRLEKMDFSRYGLKTGKGATKIITCLQTLDSSLETRLH